jgi:FMN-dependent NADH-azoreductase
MKGTDNFKQVIQEYVDNFAKENPTFAVKMQNESKNIDDCITYIITQVQASKRNGFTDDEVFGMAIHYFEEEKVFVGKQVDTMVVVNRIMENQNKPTESNHVPVQRQKPASKKQVEQVQQGQISLF